MAPASDYLETQLGTHLLRSGAFAKSSESYLSLLATHPDEDIPAFAQVIS